MDIGAIDWNAVWAEELRQNHAVVGFRTGTALWSDRGRAVRYDTQVSGRRVEETLSALPLVRAARVLDIGAGPGTLALPLARRVRTVTAVEPASGMADVLEDHIDEEGIGNISVVRTRWEDVDPSKDLRPPYDIVVASFSLGMEDLRAALRKMNDVAAGSVHLFWFADVPAWERRYLQVWPSLHGTAYHPVPKADVVCNLLWQMGIFPDLHIGMMQRVVRFVDLDEALVTCAPKFGVSGKKQEEVLRRALAGWLVPEGGAYVLRETSRYAHISWKKEED